MIDLCGTPESSDGCGGCPNAGSCGMFKFVTAEGELDGFFDGDDADVFSFDDTPDQRIVIERTGIAQLGFDVAVRR